MEAQVESEVKSKKRSVSYFFSELNMYITVILTISLILFPTLKNVDFFERIEISNLDGLLVYQLLFAAFASIAAIFQLYIVSRLAEREKACSSIKKIIYYVFSFFALFVVSWSLKEFYAPSSSFSSYFVEKEEKVNYGLVQVESGLEYELRTCFLSGKLLSCDLKITNKMDEDLDVSRLQNVSLYGQNNSEGKLDKVVFDGRAAFVTTEIHLTKKSTSNITLYFNMSEKSKSEMVKKLNLQFYYFGGYRSVTFRNIKIEKDS
ncbi:hypothetical protein ACSL9C_000745 [Vibrio navarrensis]